MQFYRDNLIWPLGIVGVLTGLALNILYHAHVENPSYYLFVTSYSALFSFSYDHRNILRLILTSALAAFLIIITQPWLYTRCSIGGLIDPLFLGTVLCVYIVHCFHWTYHQDEHLDHYPSLFLAVWNTFCLLILACIFTGIVWVLLLLASNIFQLLSIYSIRDLISKPTFIIFINAVVFNLGLAIGRDSTKVVAAMRNILLQISRVLLPFLAIIALSFILVAVLIFFFTHRPITYSFALFMSVILFGILFLNGVYQDGRTTWKYSKGLQNIVGFFLLILPIFSATIFYHLIRSAHYSHLLLQLDPATVNTTLQIIMLNLYSFGYCFAAIFNRQGSFFLLSRFNIILAVTYCVLFTISSLSLLKFSKNCSYFSSSKPQMNIQTQIQQWQNAMNMQLKNSSLTWQDYSPKNDSLNKLVLGYQGQTPIYACRSLLKNGLHPGSLFQNRCTLTLDGKVYHPTHFQILIGTSKSIFWDVNRNDNTFMAGYEILKDNNDIRSLNICRTIDSNQIRIGKLSNWSCLFNKDDKEVNTYFYQQLYVNNAI